MISWIAGNDQDAAILNEAKKVIKEIQAESAEINNKYKNITDMDDVTDLMKRTVQHLFLDNL
jgi:hypothetical protein